MSERKKFFLAIDLFAVVVALIFWSESPIVVAADKDVVVTNTTANPVAAEVLNDALYLPYIRSGFSQAPDTTGTPGAYDVTFPVPLGTRLVVETASVLVAVPAGQHARVSIQVARAIIDNAPDYGRNIYLPLQSQGVFGSTEYFAATQNLKMRVDELLDPTPPEIKVQMIRSSDPDSGSASLSATLYGYSVNLP